MGFMVSIEGCRSPAFVHDSIDEAITEALRLQKLPLAWGREARILQEVMTFPRRGEEQPLDYRAIRIQDYSIKVSVGTWVAVMRESS